MARGLAVGLDIGDERFRDHLGGVNRVRGNPEIAVGERLPGQGRDVFGRLEITF